MAPKIKIDIVGDATKFNNATKSAQTTAQKFGNSIKSGMGIGVGIGMFGLLDRAISGTIGFLGDAVAAGLEEEDSISRLNTSLAANVDGWDGNREAIEKVLEARMDLGFSDDEQRQSLALLVAATGDVSKALDIQRTAMDLSRLKQISLKDATDALTKVEAGSYRILKGLGIELKEGATQTEALAAVQKVATGQADAYATTTGGKLLIAQTKFGEKMDDLGTMLLPVVTEGVGFLTGAVDLLAGSLNIVIPWMRKFDDVTGEGTLTIENNTNAATIMEATWGTIGRNATTVWAPAIGTLGDETDYASVKAARLLSNTRDMGEAVFDAMDPVNGMVDSAGNLAGEFKSASDRARSLYDVMRDLATDKAIQRLDNIIYNPTGPNKIVPHQVAPTRAGGGSASGMTWVGEGGPELVNLPSGSMVHSNQKSMSMAGGKGITVIVNGNIYGPSGVDELMDMMAQRLRLDGV